MLWPGRAVRRGSLLCSGLLVEAIECRKGREWHEEELDRGGDPEIAAGLDAEDGCSVSVYEFFGRWAWTRVMTGWSGGLLESSWEGIVLGWGCLREGWWLRA